MTSETITPTAIDAFVHVESVRVAGRHRKDLGDVGPLAASIADVGLIHPIALTTDGRLIAGQRRLEACRRLGWAEIPVRIAATREDAAALLRAERDENICRKAMLPSELASLGAALEDIEAPVAQQRKAATHLRGRRPGGEHIGPGVDSGTDVEAQGETREAVGEALGLSGRTYSELSYAHQVAIEGTDEEKVLAREALAEMDRTGSIWPSVKKLRTRIRAKREARQVKESVMSEPEPQPEPDTDDPNWIPTPNDSSAKATARRRDLIRQCAGRGWSSHQISQHIGIIGSTVRRIAREEGVHIPADEALGKSHRKIDSNRVAREIVASLEGMEMSIDLIDYAELDRSEAENWTSSLTQSIRVLNRLNKRLKEMAQ